MLLDHCQRLFEDGADGVVLLGTTGEANSFSVLERQELLHALAQSKLPKKKVMIGTGCCAYTETISLTKTAADLGFTNILLLPPFYYKQVDDQGLIDYFSMIIDGVAHPNLHVYLYHFPKMSGINLSLEMVKKLVAKYPQNLLGMKDSSGDVNHMKLICKELPGFRLYAGTERYLLDVLRAGGAGCISATANLTIRSAAELYRNWQTEGSDQLQGILSSLRACFEGNPFIPVIKQYLAATRQDPAWLHIRPPNRLLDDQSLRMILDKFDALL